MLLYYPVMAGYKSTSCVPRETWVTRHISHGEKIKKLKKHCEVLMKPLQNSQRISRSRKLHIQKVTESSECCLKTHIVILNWLCCRKCIFSALKYVFYYYEQFGFSGASYVTSRSDYHSYVSAHFKKKKKVDEASLHESSLKEVAH